MPNSHEQMTWTEAERGLAWLPRRAVTAFAVRAARRVAPVVAKLEPVYGPEAMEWLNVLEATIRVTKSYAWGRPVSRFTLDLVAEAARVAATATATAARHHGPSPLIEEAELAYAAAAFAADSARTPIPMKAVSCAVRCAHSAAAGGDLTPEQCADLTLLLGRIVDQPGQLGEPIDPSEVGPLGPIWPHGEPAWWTEGWAKLRSAGLPKLFTT